MDWDANFTQLPDKALSWLQAGCITADAGRDTYSWRRRAVPSSTAISIAHDPPRLPTGRLYLWREIREGRGLGERGVMTSDTPNKSSNAWRKKNKPKKNTMGKTDAVVKLIMRPPRPMQERGNVYLFFFLLCFTIFPERLRIWMVRYALLDEPAERPHKNGNLEEKKNTIKQACKTAIMTVIIIIMH